MTPKEVKGWVVAIPAEPNARPPQPAERVRLLVSDGWDFEGVKSFAKANHGRVVAYIKP